MNWDIISYALPRLRNNAENELNQPKKKPRPVGSGPSLGISCIASGVSPVRPPQLKSKLATAPNERPRPGG